MYPLAFWSSKLLFLARLRILWHYTHICLRTLVPIYNILHTRARLLMYPHTNIHLMYAYLLLTSTLILLHTYTHPYNDTLVTLHIKTHIPIYTYITHFVGVVDDAHLSFCQNPFVVVSSGVQLIFYQNSYVGNAVMRD